MLERKGQASLEATTIEALLSYEKVAAFLIPHTVRIVIACTAGETPRFTRGLAEPGAALFGSHAVCVGLAARVSRVRAAGWRAEFGLKTNPG